MKNTIQIITIVLLCTVTLCFNSMSATAQVPSANTIFDDHMLLEGYTKKYGEFSKEILLAMIKDDTLTPYRSAAAVRVFQEKYSSEVVSSEKKKIEKESPEKRVIAARGCHNA